MPVGSMADVRYGWRLTIGSSDRGWRLRLAKEGIDDLDKAASLVGNATPRRSTSSLDDIFGYRTWLANLSTGFPQSAMAGVGGRPLHGKVG